MTRAGFLGAAVLLNCAGLAWRLGPWRLPLWAHHYGGGLLWGAMVFMLVAGLRPAAWGAGRSLVVAGTICAVIEFSRLLHTPTLDSFRSTLAGQLLSGRIFSPWNVVVEVLGAMIAALVARRLGGFEPGR